MLSIETVITFFTASVLLALSPGPDNIFVLTQSALRGRLPGLIVILGLCTGLLGHTAAVSLGVAIIVQTSTVAFSALKFSGAAYLLYLAWKAFNAKPEMIEAGEGVPAEYKRLYIRGIIMNITNPKVSIFFMAFLPQFTDATRGSPEAQIVLLGGLFILATILIFGGIAVLAGTLGTLLARSKHIQGILNKTAGVVFVALALRLATSGR